VISEFGGEVAVCILIDGTVIVNVRGNISLVQVFIVGVQVSCYDIQAYMLIQHFGEANGDTTIDSEITGGFATKNFFV
jgi:hypothetical protein